MFNMLSKGWQGQRRGTLQLMRTDIRYNNATKYSADTKKKARYYWGVLKRFVRTMFKKNKLTMKFVINVGYLVEKLKIIFENVDQNTLSKKYESLYQNLWENHYLQKI